MASINKIDDTDIEIIKGDTVSMAIACSDSDDLPWDFTGYTAIMQVRKSWNDTSIPPILELSTANGCISFDTNNILLTIPANLTESIVIKIGKESVDYVYDIDLVAPNSKVHKPLRGIFTIYSESTKSQ